MQPEARLAAQDLGTEPSRARPAVTGCTHPAIAAIRSAGGKPEWRAVQLSMGSRFDRSLAGVVARKPESLAGQAARTAR
jgi:hypothetical protein